MDFHMKAVFILACLCVTAYAQRDKPAFCKDSECPDFSSQIGSGYEIRTYPEATEWVGTSVTTRSYFIWFYESWLFRRLFNYISGSNSARREIDMTVPVLMKYETLDSGMVRFTMLFYLAIDNPPRPTDRSVFLFTLPAGTQFLVKSFPSKMWTSSWDYASNVRELRSAADNSDVSYNPRVHYRVSYDGPGTWDRHNEVFLEPL